MTRSIYLDNSATTPVSERAARKAWTAMTETWGNPSSVHGKGVEAEKPVSEARARLVRILGVKNPRMGSLFFTGSGTEADNMAITGVLRAKAFRGTPRIITTGSEHPAVLNPLREAEKQGFEVIRLKTVGGVLDFDELTDALTPNTVLISLMRVNNETGAIYDVKGAFALAKEKCPDIVTHCDAIQGFTKLDCDPKKLNADLVAVSGHKIGAPKGIGALWCDGTLLTKKKITPIVFGGGQESGYRSGTENVPGIVAFGEAALERAETWETDVSHVTALRKMLIDALPAGVTVNTPKGDFLPHILSLTVPGIKSEVLVRALSAEGIYLSAGSACSSKKLKTSTALTAFGLAPDAADSTVRVSLSHRNTEEEMAIFCEALRTAMGRLARKR